MSMKTAYALLVALAESRDIHDCTIAIGKRVTPCGVYYTVVFDDVEGEGATVLLALADTLK